MAALLRSARLLKISPSSLLQITATKRNGPSLSRLYSGTIGGQRSSVYVRHAAPRLTNASSGSLTRTHSRCAWPCAAPSACCTRGYAVATEARDEEAPAGVGVRTKQNQQFDWALAKLDSSVRRTGRITKTLLLRIFHDICRTGCPSGNQALLLLRSCGSLLPEIHQAERTELAHHIWEKLQGLGALYDASHYNALLKVYLQNEFKFSPTDFLAKMEAANVQPNRVTYQRLIAAYCEDGDIEGASTILGFMKSKDLPITEAVFNSLVTGHARAGDMDSARDILTVMKGAGIEPGPDTYIALLTAYAEKGDMDNVKKAIEAAEAADCSLMDRDFMQVIFSLAKGGHQQYVPEMVERMRHERGYVPDAMNLCLSLITLGLSDTSFSILKTFPTLQADMGNTDSPNLGNFFLRHCVNVDTPVEKMAGYCKELQESNLHATPLHFTLYCALEAKKTGIASGLMKELKELDLPIRPHYFWPLLTQHVKDRNGAGVLAVLKSMRELEVYPDVETFTSYILPAFPNMDAAREALKDLGLPLESEGFLSAEIRMLAARNLAELYATISDPSFHDMDLSVFRGSLIMSFRKFADIESMVKITVLLSNDERFSKENYKPSETTSFFLYNLIDSMTEMELQAQEQNLRSYFSQLKAQDFNINFNIYRGIRNILDSRHIPELIKDVLNLVDPNEQVAGSLSPATSRFIGNEAKAEVLEKKLLELKAEIKPLSTTLKQTIMVLCVEENLQRALELKREYEEEMTAGAYATLISLCCRHDNVDEALNLKTEMSRKDSSVTLDASKYIALVKALSKSGRVEEALDLLKEMKERELVLSDANVTMLFHALNTLALKGDAPVIRRLQDTIFTLGLAKATRNLCSPLVTAYLESSDVPGALEAAMECQKQYSHLPRIHDIIVALVEKGDTDLLQKAMDFVSQERGEMTMLYDLFFAFMQTGRYREARKIIETPGLRARPGRLQWYAEKCIANSQLEPLEHMVDATAKLFECDRDEMYSYILRICKDTNNWQKAETVWTKMQEENVIPRERTLRMVADILKNNGQPVPFDVPETWYDRAAAAAAERVAKPTSPQAPLAVNGKDYQIHLLALCKRGKAQEAYGIVMDAEKNEVALGPASYDNVIRTLLAQGSMEDAMAIRDIAESRVPGFQLSDIASSLLIITLSKKGQVKDGLAVFKSMLETDHVPSQMSVTRLVQALGNHGDVAGIQEVESMIKDLGASLNLSSMVFTNNTALAHIKRGDVQAAVEVLEAVYTDPEHTGQSISFVFRKLMEDGEDGALDKLSAMAERLANHFACYRPAMDLFLQFLEMDQVEEAKSMLTRCNGLAEQRDILLSYLSRLAQKPGQVGKVKTLMNLIPDFTGKETLYPYLMKCYSLDKDLASAKALYDQMQTEGTAMDELSLKRLAVLYRDAGESVPFPEPPESFKFYADKLKERVARVQTAEV